MKTLHHEEIRTVVTRLGSAREFYGVPELVNTAQAGATLANLCRGAISGCDEDNDPTGKIKAMLTQFLTLAGFELEP